MDRLKIKCLAASACFHALLAVVLLSSSAFRTRPHVNQSPDAGAGIIQLVTMPEERQAPIPATPTAAMPPAQTAAAPPAQARLVKNPEVPERSTPPKSPPLGSDTQGSRASNRSANESAANKKRLLELSRALEGMAQRMPPGKAIDLQLGSESGGKDDAYARIVRFFYSQSWEPAGNANADPKAGVKAKITIANDGKVTSARIIELSGGAPMDESVRQTLERVQFIEPFEPGARESKRTYTMNFSVRATLAAADSQQ